MPIQSCFFPYWVTETNHQLVNDGKCVGKKVGHEMTRALFCLFWFWRLGNQRKWTPAPSCAQGQWFDTVCETLSPFSNVWHCCILIQTGEKLVLVKSFSFHTSWCQFIFGAGGHCPSSRIPPHVLYFPSSSSSCPSVGYNAHTHHSCTPVLSFGRKAARRMAHNPWKWTCVWSPPSASIQQDIQMPIRRVQVCFEGWKDTHMQLTSADSCWAL